MADQPELPGADLNDIAPYVVRSNKPLAYMWSRFGRGPDGRKCKECVRCGFVQWAPRRRFYKCSFYGDSFSAATDWRANWPACGIFESKPAKP